MKNKFSSRSEIAAAIWELRHPFYVIGGFSFVINLLMLLPSLYMLQVYDRVLTSRSEMTLLMLTVITLDLNGFAPDHWSGLAPALMQR